jgi:hypothetical protein
MGVYGDYRQGSNGWDDGYEQMRDSGDDASAYHIMYAEYEPPDLDEMGDEWEEGAPAHRTSRPLSADELADREWLHSGPTARRYVIKWEWERTWQDLPDELSRRFLARPEVADLARHTRELVVAAIHRHQKLADALAFAESMAGQNQPPARAVDGC